MTEDENRQAMLAKRVKTLRRLKHLSQIDLENLSGVCQSSISSIENAKLKPNAMDVANLAIKFDVSSDYLLGLTDVKTPDIQVKTICEKTGLTEESVERLCELINADKDRIVFTFLNALIAYPSLWSMALQYDVIKKHQKYYQERKIRFKNISEYLSTEAGKALFNEMYDESKDPDDVLQFFTEEGYEQPLKEQLEFQEFQFQRLLTEYFHYMENPKE